MGWGGSSPRGPHLFCHPALRNLSDCFGGFGEEMPPVRMQISVPWGGVRCRAAPKGLKRQESSPKLRQWASAPLLSAPNPGHATAPNICCKSPMCSAPKYRTGSREGADPTATIHPVGSLQGPRVPPQRRGFGRDKGQGTRDVAAPSHGWDTAKMPPRISPDGCSCRWSSRSRHLLLKMLFLAPPPKEKKPLTFHITEQFRVLGCSFLIPRFPGVLLFSYTFIIIIIIIIKML